MHESERLRIILTEVSEKPVVTVNYLVKLLGVSEATVRRDINSLHKSDKLRRVRGGAESLNPPATIGLAGRPFSVNQTLNAKAKRVIAREAVALCNEGDSIIIGGGSTAFMMAGYLKSRQLRVMTNSFGMAEYLLKNSKCDVTLPSGKLYREQNLILSPFPDDGSTHFFASRMFFGANGVSALGVMETDSQVVQSTVRFLAQAEEKVLLVDSSKFARRSSMIICALQEVDVVITDSGIDDKAVQCVENAGCKLIIAELGDTSA